jgi:hypothetical protein
MVFSGEDKGYRSLLDEIIDAPLASRWSRGPKGENLLVDDGLVEKFSGLIGPFISRESDKIDEGMRRTRKWDDRQKCKYHYPGAGGNCGCQSSVG